MKSSANPQVCAAVLVEKTGKILKFGKTVPDKRQSPQKLVTARARGGSLPFPQPAGGHEGTLTAPLEG